MIIVSFIKMSVLSELSRRFHALTTDAKPDPPRVATESYTHNPNPSSLEVMQKSAPVTPDINKITEIPVTIQEQKSTPDSTTSETRFSKEQNSSTSDSPKGHFGPKSPRIKIKPKHKTSQNTNVVNYNIINSNGVRIGSKTKYICNLNQYTGNAKMKPESTSTKSKIKSMPAAVEELSACKEEISMDDMFVIKTHIGYGWRDVARQLGYSEGQIEQFEENYKDKGIDQVIYQILRDWKQINTKDAQLGDLVCLIWSCQEYDCVERLVAAHKTSL